MIPRICFLSKNSFSLLAFKAFLDSRNTEYTGKGAVRIISFKDSLFCYIIYKVLLNKKCQDKPIFSRLILLSLILLSLTELGQMFATVSHFHPRLIFQLTPLGHLVGLQPKEGGILAWIRTLNRGITSLVSYHWEPRHSA